MFLLLIFQLLSFFQDSIVVWNNTKGIILTASIDTNLTVKQFKINSEKSNIDFENSIIFRKITKNNRWKWFDENGSQNQISNFVQWQKFDNNYIVIQTDTGSGLVTNAGKIASKFNYTNFKNSDGIILGKMKNKMELSNDNGKIITIIPNTDKIIAANQKWIITVLNNKYGVYDLNKSNYIIAPDYDNIDFKKNNFIVTKNNKKGLFSANGINILPIVYDQILSDTLNYFKVSLKSIDAHNQLNALKIIDEKWGIFDSNGNQIISTQYAEIGNYAFGCFVVKKAENFEWIDLKEKKVSDISFKKILPFYGNFAAIQIGFYWGVINQNFKWVINPAFSEILPITDSIWILKKSRNMSFYLPKSNQVVSPSYEEIIPASGGYFKIIKNEMLGLLSPDLKPIIPAIFTKIKVFDADKIILTNKFNFYSIFYMNGNLKVRMNYSYEKYLDYENGFSQVLHKGKWGFVNTDGQIVVSTQYDECRNFSNGIAAIRIGNKWGFVNTAEKLIVSPYYDEVKDFNLGSALVRKNNLWGFVNKAGKEIQKPQFETVSQTFTNKYLVSVKGKSGIFDENGIELMSLFYKDCIELKPNFFKTRLFGKYGLVDAKNTKIIDFLYDDIIWDTKLNAFLLLKKGDWESVK
ncbi:MAG: WG repeat-containing protein [Cytophagales bacterium]|nr:MAG: WG repeat-containing protein [Cytophagales bacterium]